jgi:hypothetical protein
MGGGIVLGSSGDGSGHRKAAGNGKKSGEVEGLLHFEISG